MKAAELREKTPDELKEMLGNLKKESFNLRFQQATGQLENTSGMRRARRDAARAAEEFAALEMEDGDFDIAFADPGSLE